jgi:hypothetical protein
MISRHSDLVIFPRSCSTYRRRKQEDRSPALPASQDGAQAKSLPGRSVLLAESEECLPNYMCLEFLIAVFASLGSVLFGYDLGEFENRNGDVPW